MEDFVRTDWELSPNTGWKVFHHFNVTDLPAQDPKTARPWREHIRGCAVATWPDQAPSGDVWAFRIIVRRNLGGRGADLDTYLRPVLGAFSLETIKRDKSEHGRKAALYHEERAEYVRLVQVAMEPSDVVELEIWIYNLEAKVSQA
jgi:hypothetical protein